MKRNVELKGSVRHQAKPIPSPQKVAKLRFVGFELEFIIT